MIISFFTQQQLIPLILSSILLFCSITTFHFNKKRISIFLLFLGSIFLGYFIANLDNFLNLWDEQYHALVAKNMINN